LKKTGIWKSGFIEDYIQNALVQNYNDTSMAKLALNKGLVDNLMTRVQVEKYLADQFPDEKNDWKFVHYRDYEQNSPKKNKNIIGVVSIAGTILDGSQPKGSAGGENISAMIKEARNEKNLKALVLRVNTPGGSAFASEIIREQVLAIKGRDIPIVVSMGGLAASGGYWISADSDYIFAHESSVTGSIGVAAILFDAQETI
jgi:protease-4